MIYSLSKLIAADNSGAKVIQCIKVLGGTTRGYASVGDVIVITVKKSYPGAKAAKGTIHKAVVVRTVSTVQRKNGQHVRFDQNAAVILNNNLQPLGTRIFGPIAHELREKFAKIVSLAKDIV